MRLAGLALLRGGARLFLLVFGLAILLTGCASVSEKPTPKAPEYKPAASKASATSSATAKPASSGAAASSPSGAASKTGAPEQDLVKGKVADRTFRIFKGEYEIAPSMSKKPPGTVAVLPFGGDSKNWSFSPSGMAPTDIVRKGFYRHLSALSFRDVELYDVDRRLSSAGVLNDAQIRELLKKDPQKLQRLLNADAAVIGEVTHFDRYYYGLVSQVAVGCTIEMYDLSDGRLLWRAKHVSRGTSGGAGLDIIGLAVGAFYSLWNLREGELLVQTDDLFRELVLTIDQNLPFGFKGADSAQPPPRIDLFACLNADKPFGPGQNIGFRLVGDPGGRATVDIVGHKTGIPLRPLSKERKEELWTQIKGQIAAQLQKSGRGSGDVSAALDQELRGLEVYEGEHIVQPGEEVRKAQVKAVLERNGAKAEVMAGRTVTIDSKAKDAPAGLVAEQLDGKLRFSWFKGMELGDQGNKGVYEILMSATAASGFVVVGRTEATSLTVERLRNFEPAYFKLRSVATSGNVSAESEPLLTRALPEPGLDALPKPTSPLSGAIKGKVLLAADKSPFLIQSDLLVPSGAALYIEPGVTLRFAPGAALRVQGGDLLAYGRPDKPVRFIPASDHVGPGAFEGVVLDRAGRALLSSARIELATHGLRVRGCAPDIVDAHVAYAAQAGIALEDGARPNLRCSRLVGNQGMGGLVIEGQSVAPLIKNNSFEDNAPFQVQSFTPQALDLSMNYWGPGGPTNESALGEFRLQPALNAPPGNCSAP
jgi:hypothetical protein